MTWTGTIAVHGHTIGARDGSGATAHRYRSSVAWLPQRPHLEPGTVAETFRTLADYSGSGISTADEAETRGHRLMERLDLPSSILKQRAETLSGGETVRVALARLVLLHRPLLLLDEPGASVDAQRSRMIVDLLREELPHSTVVAVAHDSLWAEVGSSAATVRDGRLVSAETREVLQ